MIPKLGIWALNDTLRRVEKVGEKGVQTTPSEAYLNFERFCEATHGSPRALLLGTRVKNCRGVPFRGQKGLGGCRLEEASKNGEGRAEGGWEGR